MWTKIINNFKALNTRVLGMNERNIGLIYPNNKRVNYKYADDKYLAKSIMENNDVKCPKTYGVVEKIGEIEEVWHMVSEWNALVVKPAKGAGGKGIMVLAKKNGQWQSGGKVVSQSKIFSHIANIIFGVFSFGDDDRALIEEYVRPHEFFGQIYEAGVPDFRIILLRGTPLMGMLRMPTARSGGKANLHQGGLGIGIDMETGKLKRAYDGKKHMDVHPDSGSLILGRPIPYWEELVALSIKTAKEFPLDYLGVDLVIDKAKGPMVMEVNVRPGLGIQLANQQGMNEVLSTLNIN